MIMKRITLMIMKRITLMIMKRITLMIMKTLSNLFPVLPYINKLSRNAQNSNNQNGYIETGNKTSTTVLMKDLHIELVGRGAGRGGGGGVGWGCNTSQVKNYDQSNSQWMPHITSFVII